MDCSSGTQPASRIRRVARITAPAIVASASLLAAACSGGGATAGSHGKPVAGGTATYALGIDSYFSWMLPLPNEASDNSWNFNIEYDMWRPLYFSGVGTKPIVNKGMSIAYPPAWSDGDRTATIRLKPVKWSDGQPVTTRDVKFFYDIYSANKASIAGYVPGDFPDNVASVSYPSSTEFVLHLKHAVSQQWYDDNELGGIVPMPQHVWDKESTTGPVGNYDSTPAGARKVFAFLTGQSKSLSSYASNPLWKVVDGPWVISAYDPTTFRTVLVPNKRYAGPARPHLSQVVVETFQSNTAEVDALRSGSLTYGWLPFTDLGLSGYFKSHGYTVAPWAPQYAQWGEFSYTSKTYGPLVRQLYIRQALQHLVNEPLYMKATLHGLGQYTYGPVPNLPGSPYVSPQEKVNPYPYSVSAAKSLMTAHGWAPGPGGTLVCKRAGTGPTNCGAGIAAGRAVSLPLMYMTGAPALAAQVQAFQTAAKSAGIGITLDPQSQTTMFSIAGVCPPGPCNWGMAWYSYWIWDYGWADVYPTGGQEFGKGNYWAGGYYDPKAQHLIELTHTHTGLQYLYNYENYISRQVAGLWMPTWDNAISVVSNKLHGWQPQQVFGDPLPQNWYLTR